MKLIRKALAFAIVAAVAAISAFAVYLLNAPQPHVEDIAFAQESIWNALDVYFSEGTLKPQPLVFLVHGGGFRSGDQARPRHLDDFRAAGIAVAAINCRLYGEATWPAQLN